MDPKVSFIVPCYNLARFLPECVNSILSQTCGDFEVLIMDDCSADQTPVVAQSFGDSRIRYIRNEPNLGHLRNYNKGISLARGKYVWLISADDCLRRPYALERYVQLMEAHPQVGYVFCPALGIENGQETGILKWSWCGDQDAIFGGHRLLARLLKRNCVASPSGMVRRECYEKVSVFPLDMPYAGDWYLWCIFALHSDVGYFCEPMVDYRLHGLSMTSALSRRARLADILAVLWRIKEKAQEAGYEGVGRKCERPIASEYAFSITAKMFNESNYCMTFEEFEESLLRNAGNSREEKRIRSLVYAGLADGCYAREDFVRARQFYERALQENRWMAKVWAKYLLVRMGNVGVRFRRAWPAPPLADRGRVGTTGAQSGSVLRVQKTT